MANELPAAAAPPSQYKPWVGVLLSLLVSGLGQFVAGVHNISIPLDRAAFVISDEGDLYGTLSDVIDRHRSFDFDRVAAS